MKKDVLITVRGTQVIDDVPESIELITKGTMTGRNGKFAISYVETELTGTAGVVSTFLIFNPERVVLTRDGPIKSRMVFSKGVKDQSLYNLGFGSLLLGIYTKDILVDLNEDGGKLLIDYVVELEQAVTSKNTYEVIVETLKTEDQQ